MITDSKLLQAFWASMDDDLGSRCTENSYVAKYEMRDGRILSYPEVIEVLNEMVFHITTESF